MTDTDKPQLITGYKAFNKDFTCRKFQYEVGKTYKIEGDIEMCERGFHFCSKAPFDVFSFYSVIDENGEMRRFASVSCPTSKAINDDKKIVTAEITIEEDLSLSELVEEQIQRTFFYINDYIQSEVNIDYSRLLANDYGSYLASHGKGANLVAIGDSSHLATTGDCSRLTASGDSSQLAATGDYSRLTASGDSSQLAATGDYSRLTASGDRSQLITTGYGSCLAAIGLSSRLVATGDASFLTTDGEGSQLVATGRGSRLAATGDNSQCIVTGQKCGILISGKDGLFKGESRTHVAIADFNEKGKCNGFVTGCVGMDGLKENTWYTVNNGKFIECEAQP